VEPVTRAELWKAARWIMTVVVVLQVASCALEFHRYDKASQRGSAQRCLIITGLLHKPCPLN
jgi:hypothetical protein